MSKTFSKKINFVLIGIIVGLFIGVTIKQVLAENDVRADNLTVNTQVPPDEMGFKVAHGSSLFGGSVLIGNQQTKGDLSVNGQATVNGLGDGTPALGVFNGDMVVNGGKVGIGTTTPKVALDVVGDIKSSTKICIGITCVDETKLIQLITGASTASFNLAVSKNGAGTGTVKSSLSGIDCGGACSASFSSGALVTLTATPDAGSTIASWSPCSGTGTCTVNMTQATNVSVTFALSGGTTPPPAETPVCTGSHPAEGNGVQLSYYYTSTTCISPGPCNTETPNTVWKYGDRSCGWSCESPMVRNGDFGCENPPAGSGTTITVNDLSTGNPFGGVGVKVWSWAYVMAGTTSLGDYTTGTNGKTREFWIGKKAGRMGMLSMTIVKNGYKIRTATGCTPAVRQEHDDRGAQMNLCGEPSDGTPVVIDMVPGDISTLPVAHFEKSTYRRGETLKGYITGGNPNRTWACIDTPVTPSAESCIHSEQGWRQLTQPYGGQADDWKLVETNQGDTLRMENGLIIGQDFPLGTYTQYVRTGDYFGTDSKTNGTITVVE